MNDDNNNFNPTSVYHEHSVIGEGSFSTVLLTHYGPKRELRALKIAKVENPEIIAMFKHEYDVLKRVSSENVLKPYGLFSYDGIYYLALEYAQGGDLKCSIESSRRNGKVYSERSIWYYFHQICNAVNDLHELEIAHCDLKPDNIFMFPNGQIKIGDFGLSYDYKYNNAPAVVGGTHYYLPPEKPNRNQVHASRLKGDIWALGCILYEMCMQRSPYVGERLNSYALRKKKLRHFYPPLSTKYSKQLRHFVTACMAVNPDHRPTSAMLLEASLIMYNHFENLLREYRREMEEYQSILRY